MNAKKLEMAEKTMQILNEKYENIKKEKTTLENYCKEVIQKNDKLQIDLKDL